MNAPIPPPAPRPYTAADLFHLIGIGVVDPAMRVELIDGVLTPMSPKGRQHEIVRESLALWLKQPWAQAFNVLQEHTLVFGDCLLLEPDFILYDAGRRIADAPLAGKDVRLLIEVADSSLSYVRRLESYLTHGEERSRRAIVRACGVLRTLSRCRIFWDDD